MTDEMPEAPWWMVTVHYVDIVTVGEYEGIRPSKAKHAVQGINLADALNVAVPLIRDRIRPASFAHIVIESVPRERADWRHVPPAPAS